jgi:hypothetical protein
MIEFVDKFLAVIMKTAGWKGMRIWLLASSPIFITKCYSLSFCLQLLAKHKYLTGDDVVAVMSYYETVAGIGPRPITTSVTDQSPTCG